MKRMLVYIGSLALLTLVFLILQPNNNLNINDCECLNVEVVRIYLTSNDEICLKVKDNQDEFYIDIANSTKISIEELQLKLIDEKIVLWYIDSWDPFDLDVKRHRIVRIEYYDEMIYNQIVDYSGN